MDKIDIIVMRNECCFICWINRFGIHFYFIIILICIAVMEEYTVSWFPIELNRPEHKYYFPNNEERG